MRCRFVQREKEIKKRLIGCRLAAQISILWVSKFQEHGLTFPLLLKARSTGDFSRIRSVPCDSNGRLPSARVDLCKKARKFFASPVRDCGREGREGRKKGVRLLSAFSPRLLSEVAGEW